MFETLKERVVIWMYDQITMWIEVYAPKVLWALIILWIWALLSYLSYKAIRYLFKKFKIVSLIDKLFNNLSNDISNWDKKVKAEIEKEEKKAKISDKVKIDVIVWKAAAYYLFLIFFRFAIVFIGIREVEKFLWELIAYLPSLFIAIIIWFLWVRFANFVYGVVFNTLDLTKQKTAKIIASGAKIIILFFTLMVVLEKIWIAAEITNTILIWFVWMLTIAGWLAFGLGWKDVAQEILESFRK